MCKLRCFFFTSCPPHSQYEPRFFTSPCISSTLARKLVDAKMLACLAAAQAFVAPQPMRSPTVHRGIGPTVQPQMGFFDELKKGFENDDRLQNIADKTASGKTQNAAAYVKQKAQAKATYEAKASARAGQKQADESDDKMAEFLGKFKW